MADTPFHRDPRNLLITALGIAVVSLGTILTLRQTAPDIPPPPPPAPAAPAAFVAPSVDPALQPLSDSKGGRNAGKTPYELNQVRNTITKNTASIRACYIKFTETKPAVTDGKVLVDWQIKGDGSVLSAEIVSSDLQSELLHQCITGSIKTWAFPPPPTDRPVYTTFTFVFKDEKTPASESSAPSNGSNEQAPKG